jgi:hypothetical protein
MENTKEPQIHLSFNISLAQFGDLMNVIKDDNINEIDISIKKSFNSGEFSISLRNAHWSIRSRLESLFQLSEVQEVDAT